MTDDDTLRIVSPPLGTPGVWSGKDQAAAFLAFSKSQNPHVEHVGCGQVPGDHVTVPVLVLNNDFRKWQVGAIEHQYAFVVQDGKIQSFMATMAMSERTRIQLDITTLKLL